jgi:hypothetical protein
MGRTGTILAGSLENRGELRLGATNRIGVKSVSKISLTEPSVKVTKVKAMTSGQLGRLNFRLGFQNPIEASSRLFGSWLAELDRGFPAGCRHPRPCRLCRHPGRQ